MWQVENHTPFPHHAGFLRDEAARTFWAVTLKASYIIRPGRPCLLASDPDPLWQAPLMAPLTTGARLVADTDIALGKPRCDVLVEGLAYPPQGHADAPWLAGVKIGDWQKAVQVMPPARWQRGRAEAEGPDHAPVPMTWDQTWGGPDHAENPAGQGHHANAILAEGRPLPRLVPPGWQPGSEFAPTSLAPVPRDWPQRRALGGTYDARWQATRAPLLPADLVPAFWQSAPPDQQVDADILPGAVVELVALTPYTDGAPVVFPLPAPRFEIVIRFRGRWHPQEARLQTLHLWPERMRVTLAWLSLFQIPSVQDDVGVERTFLALRDAGGARVAAADSAAYLSPAREEA